MPEHRSSDLDGAAEVVAWSLRRSRRARRLRVVVRFGRVEVVAPWWLPRRRIDRFVEERAAWIREKVREWQRRQVETLPERFVTGERVRFRGRSLRLTVAAAEVARPELIYRSAFRVRLPRGLPAGRREDVARKLVVEWLRQRLLSDAEKMIARWAPELGAAPAALRIGNQKTLWGSCSPRGVISLNWRLIALPRSVLEYVVVHELCHLLERNHGPGFWRLVERLLPDWRERRRRLRRHGIALG